MAFIFFPPGGGNPPPPPPPELTLEDLDTASVLLNTGGPASAYRYIETVGGFSYPALAIGVAEGGTLAGESALSYMQAFADRQGTPLTSSDIETIRYRMAEEYIETLRGYAGPDGVIAHDVSANDAQTFHATVFEEVGLSIDAWTLTIPFRLLGIDKDAYWDDLLEAAGDSDAEFLLSMELLVDLTEAADSTEDVNDLFLWGSNLLLGDPLPVTQEFLSAVDDLADNTFREIKQEAAGDVVEYFTSLGHDLYSAFLQRTEVSDIQVASEAGDTLNAQEGQFTLIGNSGEDVLNGNSENNDLYGGSGDDVLNSGSGNNTLEGGSGDDVLNSSGTVPSEINPANLNRLDGGAGNDVSYGSENASELYILNRDGDVNTTYVSNSTDQNDYSDQDVLLIEDASKEQIWLSRDNENDLTVSIVGTEDAMTLKDWFASDSSKLDGIIASNGDALFMGEVLSLVDAMSSFSPPSVGELDLDAETRLALDPHLAAAWTPNGSNNFNFPIV